MARKRYAIGNWKMNSDLPDAMVLGHGVKEAIAAVNGVEVVLCPPFVWLYPLAEILRNGPKNISLGAQNMHWEEKGTFTGEVSGEMLKNIVKYVILGHSERRYYFNESDDIVYDKLVLALHYGLTPILCVGEKKKSETGDVKALLAQLNASLGELTADQVKKIVIAYEPIWAISSGDVTGKKAATGDYAGEVIKKIRDFIEENYGKTTAEAQSILYGGSVTAANIDEYMGECEIDGVLVGGASLRINEFVAICKSVGQYR